MSTKLQLHLAARARQRATELAKNRGEPVPTLLDEKPITYNMGYKLELGKVIIEFNMQIKNQMFEPEHARTYARNLLDAADKLEAALKAQAEGHPDPNAQQPNND